MKSLKKASALFFAISLMLSGFQFEGVTTFAEEPTEIVEEVNNQVSEESDESVLQMVSEKKSDVIDTETQEQTKVSEDKNLNIEEDDNKDDISLDNETIAEEKIDDDKLKDEEKALLDDKKKIKKSDELLTSGDDKELHTLTIHANGGTISIWNYEYECNGDIYSIKESDDGIYLWESDFSKSGYAFGGLYQDEACIQSIVLQYGRYKLEVDTDVYVKWIKKCTVSFNLGDGIQASGDYKLQVPQGVTISQSGFKIPKNPKACNENEVFEGWYKDAELNEFISNSEILETVVTEDITYYAKYTSSCTVTFDLRGGHVYRSTYQIYTAKVPAGEKIGDRYPSVENDSANIVFKGWYAALSGDDVDESTEIDSISDCVITEDTTIYAGYDECYVITFHSNKSGVKLDGKSETISVKVPKGQPYRYYKNNWDKEATTNAPQVDYAISSDGQLPLMYEAYERTFAYSPSQDGAGDLYFFSPYYHGIIKSDGSYNRTALMSGDYQFIPTSDMDLYLVWRDKVKVTFDGNGQTLGDYDTSLNPNPTLKISDDKKQVSVYAAKGSILENIFASSQVSSVYDESLNAYRSAKWCNNPECTQIIDRTDNIDEDTILYAKWDNIGTYWDETKIRLHAQDGYFNTIDTNSTVMTWSSTNERLTVTIPKSNEADKAFKGWYKDSECKQLYTDTVIKDYGKFFIPKKDYISDLYAGYAKAKKVKLVANGGYFEDTYDGNNNYDSEENYKGNTELHVKELIAGQGICISDYTNRLRRDGNKVFAGWYKDKNFTEKITTETYTYGYDFYLPTEENTTLYAKWINYSKPELTLDMPESIKVSAGGTYQLKLKENPEDDGNLKWVVDDYGYNDTTKKGRPTVSVTSTGTLKGLVTGYAYLHAELNGVSSDIISVQVINGVVENEYSIFYELNGGINSANNPTSNITSKEAALEPAIKEGYTFAGWYLDENFRQKVSKVAKGIKNDIVLYAKWTPNKYRVTFDATGGKCAKAYIDVTYGNQFGTLPIPTKSGFNFSGWSSDLEGNNLLGATSVYTTAGNSSVYAQWTPVTVKVNLVTTASDTTSIKVTYTEKYVGLTSPERTGYTFAGWFDENGNIVTADTTVNKFEEHSLYAKWSGKTLSAPKASETSGEIVKGTCIELTCDTNNAEIYYTLDGTQPDENSSQYVEPIVITEDTVVKSIAIKDGFDDSAIAVYSYTVVDSELTQGEVDNQDLPAGATLEEQIDEIPEDFWISDIPYQTYTGMQIKPEFRVYFGKKKLEEKKDYTVSFKNNTNVGKAQITINGRDNYAGKFEKTFDIVPLDITTELDKFDDILVAYTARAQKPSFKVNAYGKNLALNKEYRVSWVNENGESNGGCKEPGTYDLQISGINNYTGSVTKHFIINEKEQVLMSSVTVARVPDQKYEDWVDGDTGEVAAEPELKVTYKNKPLVEGQDYTVDYSNNTSIGTATAILTGTGSTYVGSKTVTFKLVGTNINTFKICYTDTENGKEKVNYNYTGEKVKPCLTVEKVVTVNREKTTIILEQDVDYDIDYQNNVKAGSATVVVTGTGAYSGQIKRNFTITPFDMTTNEDFKVTVSYEADNNYITGGVTPNVDVKFDGNLLELNKDYTIRFNNNRSVLASGATDKNGKPIGPNFVISGKGNFKGKLEPKYFSIEKQDIGAMSIEVPDKTEVARANAYVSTPVIKEIHTSKLTALRQNTDYEAPIYQYDEDTTVLVYDSKLRNNIQVQRYADDVVQKVDIIPANTVIRVTANGKNNYKGSISATYRIMATNHDISKAKVVIPDQYFSGNVICPGKDLMTVTMVINRQTVTLDKKDYEIVGYINNLKKGTATVTLHGKGQYGGTKNATFRIVNKSMFYTVYFDNNGGKGIMRVQQISVARTKLAKNTFTRKGYTFLGWSTTKDATTAEYMDQIEIDPTGKRGENLQLYAVWSKDSYSIIYHLEDGVINTSNNPTEYEVDSEKIVFETATREHYTFSGWYKDSNCRTKITEVKTGSIGNLDLYPKWTPIKYKIAFNANGGVGANKLMTNFEYGKMYTLARNTYTRKGYTFVGWSNNKNAIEADYTDQQKVENLCGNNDETITLYAIWKKN